MKDAPTPAPLMGVPGELKSDRSPAQPKSAKITGRASMNDDPISPRASQYESPARVADRWPRTV